MVLAHHIIAEFKDCCETALEDQPGLENCILDALKAGSFTVVQSNFYKFDPIGFSGVVILSESSFCLHSWTEYQYAAIDLFYCGKDCKPDITLNILKQFLKTENVGITKIDRGAF